MTEDDARNHALDLVDSFLDERLRDANEPPGLRQAIVEGVARQREAIQERGTAQVNQLRSPASSRIPDAYLEDEVVLEDELQRNAAGIRIARALEGRLLVDPRQFEYALNGRLAPLARWAMRGEACRVPRPPTRPAALRWSLSPVTWVEDESEWPPPGALALHLARQLTGPDAEPVRVSEEPYAGWVQIGLFEQQRTLARSYPDVPVRQLLVATGLEVCDGPPPEGSLPLSSARPLAWVVSPERLDPGLDFREARTVLASTRGPLAAIVDYDHEVGAPHRLRGLGLQPFALVPRLEVVVLLGLRPELPALRHVLVDDQGPGLVGRLWRGFLIHDGNYTPLVPGVQGSDLLVRPDLYDRLEATVGRSRINMGCMIDVLDDTAESDERAV